jgi:amino acid adenylation domain-containing protein
MVISILAVLKAGGAYVPLSVDTPQERTVFLCNDTQAALIITDTEHLPQLQQWQADFSAKPRMLAVDEPNISASFASSNLESDTTATDVAYVMYTSGTTGTPKGVLNTQRNVVSLVCNTDYIDIQEDDVFLQLSSVYFDASTFEIWGALLHGAKLVVPTVEQHQLAEQVSTYLKDYQVSVLWLTRALFDQLYLQQPAQFGLLRYLLVGGEALTPHLIRQLVAQKQRPRHILNGYGPTEGTTFTTIHRCEEFRGSVPLGKPINTRKVYVVDRQGHIVPIGIYGELVIAGAGVAKGYLNRPQLSEERFVPNTFAATGLNPARLNLRCQHCRACAKRWWLTAKSRIIII